MRQRAAGAGARALGCARRRGRAGWLGRCWAARPKRQCGRTGGKGEERGRSAEEGKERRGPAQIDGYALFLFISNTK